MRILGICGSANARSYTSLALARCMGRAKSLGAETDVIEIRDFRLKLPGLDDEHSRSDVAAIEARARLADAFILATPEYHGSYSSGIKLLIDQLGYPSAMQGKPVALVGVAAGRIGAIKALEHLASVCGHLGAIVLPGNISIANVREEFDTNGVLKNPATARLLDTLVENLVAYLGSRVSDSRADSVISLEQIAREGKSPKNRSS